MHTRKITVVSLVPLIMVLAFLCLAIPSSTATAQKPETLVPDASILATSAQAPAAALVPSTSAVSSAATAQEPETTAPDASILARSAQAAAAALAPATSAISSAAAVASNSAVSDIAAVASNSAVSSAAALLAASAVSSAAAAPATSTVSGTPVSPAAFATVNFAQLAQQEGSNPSPANQPQTAPQALPGGQDSNGAAGTSPAPQAGTQLASPAPSVGFEALGDNNTATPAGVSGAVGPNDVLTALNSQIRIQDRSGAVLGAVATNRFWAAALPTGSTGAFDLRALYDPFNQRWILAAASDAANANSALDLAVSATGDPTGNWYLFRYDADAQNLWWADYAMLGMNRDWIVVSANMFTSAANSFVQGQVYALNKANLYANNSTGSAVFADKAIPFSLQPAETYDNNLGTEYLVRHVSSANGTVAKSTLVGSPPSLPTLTIDTAIVTSNLGGWSVPSGNLLPQSGSSVGLDAGDARVQQVVVRTVSGQTSIWFAQTIALPAGGAPTHAAVQWWQVDGSSASSAAILQQGRVQDPTATQTNGGVSYAYPSLAVNQNNDVLLGYGQFSSNQYPGAAYSFRAGTDAPNTMRGTTLLKAGMGPYVKTLGSSLNRWGDFSHTVVDPADNTSLWTIQAYADTPVGTGDGSGRWATWWGLVQPSGATGVVPVPVPIVSACYTLATSESPDGTGSIGLSPTPNCNYGTQYASGTIVTLTAYANGGYYFSSWSGDVSGSSNPVTIGMDANKSVTANFATTSSSSAFGKTSPGNGATGQATALTLYWNGSSGASSYVYCLDTNNNNLCDTSWTNVGSSTSADVSGLGGNTTYYWQVRSLDANGNLIARADDGAWWTFTTGTGSPGAFGKTSPSNGATAQPTSLTLSWNGSSGATDYQYCIDTTNNSSCDASWIDVGTHTTAGLSGLGSNSTYYWQVRALNGDGTTGANGGAWWTFTTGTAAPGAFGKSSPSNGATGQPTSLTLSWGASSGATDYQYCIDTTNNSSCNASWIDVGTKRSASLSGLSGSTTYYWQVRALNGAGTTAANGGAWWSLTTRNTNPPGAFGKSSPSNGATDQPTSLTLTWGSSSGATGYQYCIDTTNNSRCDGNNWKSADSHTSVKLIGLNYITTYYWQVRALNANGTTVADSGTWWSLTTETSIPVANDDFNSATPITTLPFSAAENTTNATTAGDDPSFVCTGTQGTASVWFSFTPAGDGLLKANTTGSSFNTILAVWQGARGSLSSVACNDNAGGGGTSAVTVNLTGGTTYYLEVAGHVDGGGLKMNVSFAGTKPAPVKLLAPANGSQSTKPSQVLDWTDSAGATYYQLQVHKGSANGTVVVSAQPTASTYTTGDLAPAHYFWRVQACNANGCSAPSATWSFQIQAQASKPAPPTLASPANGDKITGQANLNWSDSAGATYYQVAVRQGTTFGPIVAFFKPTQSAVTTSGLKSGHWYDWHVQACNIIGCSAWTGWWRFLISK